ncbi:coiled-coil domain-containing protein [Brevundimonas goettingensis]|uniref:Uncharacterized protein n=1 Tax=Brevundimonas goettingensis TaxID=2774190 RepID=A0A975GVA3_9CAUL|nr:hypothetical protein [Brevundimonas goettingensis]QTC91182.1 hypothetical protein IFJ75_18625 [Brevundimonas goettingensis]
MTKAVRPRPAKTPVKATVTATAETLPGKKAITVAPPAAAGPAPVFLHSGFRTSSTWLWKHFRERPAFRAYYEIFHEALGGLRMDAARTVQSDQWRSRHPSGAPYFLEFIPLMDPAGGIRGFTGEPALAAAFFPDGGLGGDLPSGEVKYVAGLIANAQDAGRIPVLTCTRTLGRADALKRRFGGTHILIHRNLFHQWNSFSGQHRTGNLYFLEYLFLIIARSRDDAFMDLLKTFTPADIETDFPMAIESRYDDAFAIFVAWHVYMTLHATRSADIVIDVTRLASDDAYRLKTEARIRETTGQALDLGDATTHVDAPWRPIQNPETTKLTVRLLVDSAYAALGATSAEQALGEEMVASAWAEHRAHATYTQAYFEAADAAPRRLGQRAPQGALSYSATTVTYEDEASPLQDENDALQSDLNDARQALIDQEALFAEAEDRRTALSRAIVAEERDAILAYTGAETQRLKVALEASEAAGAALQETYEVRIAEQAAELTDLRIALELQATAQAAALAARTAELDQLKVGFEATEAATMELRQAHTALTEQWVETNGRAESLTAELAETRSMLEAYQEDNAREASHARAAVHNALADAEYEKGLRLAAVAREAELTEALSVAEAGTAAVRDEADATLKALKIQVNANAALERDRSRIMFAFDATRAREGDLEVDAARSAARAAELLAELEGLRLTLDYERIAREAATAEAAEARRALAYLEVAHRAAQDDLEHATTATAKTNAELSAAHADDARSREQAESLAGDLAAALEELGLLQQARDEIAAARDDLQIRMDGAVQENMRLARLAETRSEELEALSRTLTDAEEGRAAALGRLAESAAREAGLQAALEQAGTDRDAVVAERDSAIAERHDLGQRLADRQAELASIKEGVTWRAASTLKRLGVG